MSVNVAAPSSSATASTPQLPRGDAVEETLKPQQDHSMAHDEKRGVRFWLVFSAICLCLLLAALDMGSMATALPSIVHDLGGTASFAWVSTAYTLACTAILPLTGRLADIFGRKPVLQCSLVVFTVGSVICAQATSMNMLIAGRTVQGVGSGGIQSLTAIVVADLVPLRERGFYNAITGATFSAATAAGPFIGGGIVENISWRWLFYINLPLCALAFAVVLVCLKLKAPPSGNVKETILKMDFLGNTIIIGSTTSCIISLTWAGVTAPWSSPRILVPLLVGLSGLVAAFVYEGFLATHPSIPLSIVSNRTTLSGYFGSFLHGIVLTAVAFYLPVYFQATKVASPLLSGLYLFPLVVAISPSAIVQGLIIGKTGRYWMINCIGWALMLLGVGLLCLLGPSSSVGITVPFQLFAAIGFGFLYATTFSVLAPLEPTTNASALALLLFARTFSKSWSVAIGATILQNRLRARLPPAFLSRFTPGEDLTYIGVPEIASLSEPLQSQVRAAYADSLQLLWKVLLVVCAVGFLSVFAQKELPLHSKRDENWGMKKEKEKSEPSAADDKEKGSDTVAEATQTATLDGVSSLSNTIEEVATEERASHIVDQSDPR